MVFLSFGVYCNFLGYYKLPISLKGECVPFFFFFFFFFFFLLNKKKKKKKKKKEKKRKEKKPLTVI